MAICDEVEAKEHMVNYGEIDAARMKFGYFIILSSFCKESNLCCLPGLFYFTFSVQDP